MAKLSSSLSIFLNGIADNSDASRKAYRATQVRNMWTACVDNVFLDHTNSVYIINDKGIKTLIVYVDESIYAAELNGKRELIKLKFLKEFNENIEEFKILISRSNYKNNYPFKKDQEVNPPKNIELIALTKEEKIRVEEIVAVVENTNVRENLKKAITLDWELKKGSKKSFPA